jgi:hypothetical protein
MRENYSLFNSTLIFEQNQNIFHLGKIKTGLTLPLANSFIKWLVQWFFSKKSKQGKFKKVRKAYAFSSFFL